MDPCRNKYIHNVFSYLIETIGKSSLWYDAKEGGREVKKEK